MYFLYDVCCSLQTIFELPIGNLTIAVSAMQRYAEKFISVHIYILSLNYNGGILLKFLSYLYEVVRTTFFAHFWPFRNFRPQFHEICGAIWQRKLGVFIPLKGRITTCAGCRCKNMVPFEKNDESSIKIDP